MNVCRYVYVFTAGVLPISTNKHTDMKTIYSLTAGREGDVVEGNVALPRGAHGGLPHYPELLARQQGGRHPLPQVQVRPLRAFHRLPELGLLAPGIPDNKKY